jgi:hypothetical protein
MIDRFRSKALELPEAGRAISRADLTFYEVDHSGPTFEARIFLGARRKPSPAAGIDHPDYAGSFFVFGHVDCYGEAGHCEIPGERDPYDLRLPHHLEPSTQIVTVTDAVERLLAAGKSEAVVDILALGPHGEALEALSFTTIRLLTYA